MSRSALLISVWLCGHTAALVLSAFPSPTRFIPSPLGRTADNPISGALSGYLDGAAAATYGVTTRLWHGTSSIRRFTNRYLRATGLLTQWRMFLTPSTADEYVRIQYRVRSGPDGSAWMAKELVLPRHPEDEIRGVRAYRYRALEKAISSSLDRVEAVTGSVTLGRPDAREALAPVVKYFARKFRSDELSPSEQLYRTELWLGSAPNPRPGARESSRSTERRAVLQPYYSGSMDRLPPTTMVPLGTSEREADITWRLVFFE